MFCLLSCAQFTFSLLNSLPLLNTRWITTFSLVYFKVDVNLSFRLDRRHWWRQFLREVWNCAQLTFMVEIYIYRVSCVVFIVLFLFCSVKSLETVRLWFAFLKFRTQYDSLLSKFKWLSVHISITKVSTELKYHFNFLPNFKQIFYMSLTISNA